MTTPNDGAGASGELRRLREEHRQISDLLILIQNLTAQMIGVETVSGLFSGAFRTLFEIMPFDIAVAVMFEQNLDLHVITRSGSHGRVSDELIEKLRRTLESIIPSSFVSTEVVVKSEENDLPPAPAGGGSDHGIHAVLNFGNRIAGILFLYRSDPPFTEEMSPLLEIFSTQVSMLLANLQTREKLMSLADTDDLTGISNKRLLRRHLPFEIDRARVYGVPLSLLLFDIDDFKQINDNFGHTVGDVVLSELCGAVKEIIRPTDFFARFGGDEFALILPHTDLPGARAVADRLLRKLQHLLIPTDDEASIRCSVSIGIAEFALEDTPDSLVRRADDHLYASKRGGKNRYTYE